MLVYTFYKIGIKGTKYCYIGSSKDVTKRLYMHKDACSNSSAPNYNCKIYECLRENGGWSAAEVTIIDTREFDAKEDVLIQEQKYIVQYKANLNMVAATGQTLQCLIDQKNLTANLTTETRLKRKRLGSAIWKKSAGKEKYNLWQRNYMRKKMCFKREAKRQLGYYQQSVPEVAF
tara:strand:+ start:198 stop:722 length:525 start_codon:yes stop_codon:yes gene_type:complete